MKSNLATLSIALLLTTVCHRTAADPPSYSLRWVYASHNLLVDKNANNLIALIERAGKSGYNGLVLADYKFNILGRMPERYFTNARRVQAAAAQAGLEIIPTVFPIGYSSGLLAHDPNLAEGVPVKNAPFIVRGSRATLDSSQSAKLVNGGFEDVKENRFAGFSLQDDPGKTTFADRDAVHEGKTSVRMQDIGKHNRHGHGRFAQKTRLRPFACYRLSCWVRTQGFRPAGAFKLMALGVGENSRPLTFHEVRLKADQDWTRIAVVFNSLDQTDVNLYAGQWGGQSGTLWLDDFKLEEIGLINVLRRDGCPLTVSCAEGATVFVEGKDYETVRDEKLGQDPYAGEYSFDHESPVIKLTAGSRIKNGDKLLVSWHHPILIHDSQVGCCLAAPKIDGLLRDQAKRVNDLFHPKTFFMSHDEIRVAGWCRDCQSESKTPGEALAANARRCVRILKELRPDARIVVWSDMFDPHHNAVNNYYLVNGDLKGSWEGLPPDVFIANWNGGNGAESLKFFADRGHKQVIAGYYDGDLGNLNRWKAAATGVKGVEGFMYTTWEHKYEHLEEYGKALRPSK